MLMRGVVSRCNGLCMGSLKCREQLWGKRCGENNLFQGKGKEKACSICMESTNRCLWPEYEPVQNGGVLLFVVSCLTLVLFTQGKQEGIKIKEDVPFFLALCGLGSHNKRCIIEIYCCTEGRTVVWPKQS